MEFNFDTLVKSLNSKRGILHYRLHCSFFISFPFVSTLFIFTLFLSTHSLSHSFHLSQSISFTFSIFGCNHITLSFSFTFQQILSLEINDLKVSLDKVLKKKKKCFILEISRLLCFCEIQISKSVTSSQVLLHNGNYTIIPISFEP